MKKLNYILIGIGIFLIVIPFFIRVYSIFRLISVLLGIVTLLLGLIIGKGKKILKIVIYPIIIMGFVLAGDFLFSSLFKGIPIISFVHSSSSKVNTYNSLFYRVYDCEGVLSFDHNYQKAYLCNHDAIEMISVNKFLENPIESYNDYQGKFVRLKGKISTIVGNSSLSFNTYNENIELNGYVDFDENKKVVINDLKINPTEYYIYDFVEVIGLVSDYEKKQDQITVYLDDAIVIKSDLYDNYDLIVNNISSLEKTKIDEKMYYLGIQGIFYKFDENNIYEIDYLLLDKRLSIDTLIKDIPLTMIDNVHKLYELEKYNLVICDNDDIIFANKDIINLKNICSEDEN